MFLDRELLHPRSPAAVRQWAATLPAWADVRSPRDASRFTELGPGEREAIALALETNADFLLIDETDGRRTAIQNGVPDKGTLGMLEEAAKRNLVDLTEAVGKLKATGIFLSEDIVQGVSHSHYGPIAPRRVRAPGLHPLQNRPLVGRGPSPGVPVSSIMSIAGKRGSRPCEARSHPCHPCYPRCF